MTYICGNQSLSLVYILIFNLNFRFSLNRFECEIEFVIQHEHHQKQPFLLERLHGFNSVSMLVRPIGLL